MMLTYANGTNRFLDTIRKFSVALFFVAAFFGISSKQAHASGYPITFINSPTWSSNIPSALSGVYSVNFNGTNQYGTASDIGLPAGSSSFTISWWQKTSIASTTDFYAWSYGTSNGKAILGGIYQSKLFGYNASGVLLTSAASVNDNAWHNGILTYDGTTLKMYLDGALVTSTSTSLGTLSSGTFRIGSSLINGTNLWAGSLTGIRIYDRALSTGDVTTLAGGGNPSATPVREYDFTEGSGTALADSGTVPSGHAATLLNSPTWSSNIPSALSGVYSLNFNGTNQYVTASDSGLPIGNSPFTVSWWQKTSNALTTDFYAWSYGTGAGTAILGGMYQGKLFGYNASGALLQSSASVNDNAWHSGILTYDGTSLKLYLDGTQAATTNVTLGTVRNGTFHIGSSLINGSNLWAGSITGVRIYGKALSTGDVTTLAGGGNPSATPVREYDFTEGSGTALADSGIISPLVIGDGNSLTAGVGSSDSATENYVSQMQPLLKGTWDTRNFGVGGQTTEDMNSDAASQVDTTFDISRPENIVIAWDGINSINNINDTAAQAYAAMTTYIQARKAAGFKVMVLTAMKWGSITGAKEIIRQDYNSLVLANSAGADLVFDVATDPHFTDPTNATYFNADTVHLVDAGYAVLASLLAKKVDILATPLISSVASSTTGTSATVTWTTDLDSTSTLNYGLTASYGTASTSLTNTKSHSITLTGLASGTKYYFQAASGAIIGNVATSSGLTFTTDDLSPPVITVSTTTPGTTSAVVTWNTNKIASTKVTYGPADTYGTSTPVTDTSPRVFGHSANLSNLLACTTYHFVVTSSDATLRTSTSSDQTFMTSGCAGNTTQLSSTSTTTLVSATSSSSLTQGDSILSVVTPHNFASTSPSVVIQIQGLPSTEVIGALGKPSSSLSNIGNAVFDVKAMTDSSTLLSSFDLPVTITYRYSDADIAGIDELSLWLYHYHNGSWSRLDSCSIDTSANTITCTTTSFSVFALFGQASTVAAVTSSTVATFLPSSARIYGCKDLAASNYNYFSASDPSLCVYKPKEASSSPAPVARDLRVGLSGDDVKELQRYLNSNGFALAQQGPGSPGNETTMFGALTRTALATFQKNNGIAPAAGYFGPLTRAKMKIAGSTGLWW